MVRQNPTPSCGGAAFFCCLANKFTIYGRSNWFSNLIMDPITTRSRGRSYMYMLWAFTKINLIRVMNLSAFTKINLIRVRIFYSSLCCAATVMFSIPSVGVHRRTGEQVFETSRLLGSCTKRGRIRFLGSAQRDCSTIFATARPPSKSGAAAYRRLQCHLLRSARTTAVVQSAPFFFPKEKA